MEQQASRDETTTKGVVIVQLEQGLEGIIWQMITGDQNRRRIPKGRLS